MMICAREVKDKLLFEMSEKNSVISDMEDLSHKKQ